MSAGAATSEGMEGRLRRGLEASLGVLGLEMLFVVVSGGASLLDPGGAPTVSPFAFAIRAVLFAGALLLRYGALASGRADRARLLLVLLALPALAQFQFAGGRMGGDGISYYVYVRSLMKDFDLDFTNEYTHYGWIERGDIKVPTVTGRRRSIFSVGPGLVSVPFFVVGEAVGRLRAAAGASVDLSGYGDVHVHAVGLGGFLLGLAAVLLTHAVLRRHFSEGPALLTALLVWFATFLYWYMTQQPIVSHAASTAAAALVLLVWDRGRGLRNARGYFSLGALLGLAMCLRWQNGVFLLLPALELWRRLRGEGLPLTKALREGGLLLAGTLVGALPQMLAWKTLYGVFLLPAPPHGRDFLRLDHPYILNTLFSSRHGLLAWTPVLWAGFLGFLPLVKRRPGLALPLLPPLLVMTYVNMCSGDWWAGGSFSNRRFDSLLPVLALGLAATIESATGRLRRRPELVLALVAVPFMLGNATLVEQVRRGLVPRDDTVDGPVLGGQSVQLVSDAVGFPTTWPASWIFAAETGLSPGRYDRVVGQYLFYRQNNLGGLIKVGDDEGALLGEGWGRPQREGGAGGVPFRLATEAARVLAPLDVPEDLEVEVRASAEEGTLLVGLLVNGREAGQFAAGAGFASHRIRVPAAFWRRELNDVTLVPEGPLRVSSLQFYRTRARR